MSRAEPAFPTTPISRLKPPAKTNNNISPVHALTFSSGTGQYLLTGSQDRQIRLYNPSTSRLIQTYAAHGYEVLDLAVSADNATFASCGGDKVVFVWDTSTAQTVRRFTGHAGRVNGVCFGGEGGAGGGESVVVSGSFDGRVCVWDLRARGEKAMATFGEATDAVSCVEVLGHEIFAGCVDGRVRIYDLVAGRVEVDCLPASVTSVAPARVSGAGDSYLVSTLDSALRLMDHASGKCLQKFQAEGYHNEAYRIRSCFAMAESCVVGGSEDGKVWVWDVLTGTVRHRLVHTEGGSNDGEGGKKKVVSVVAWNQMRKMLASAGGDGEVAVWGMGED